LIKSSLRPTVFAERAPIAQRMIRKSGYRFSEEIMLNQKPGAQW
jgi:hypothetical protein